MEVVQHAQPIAVNLALLIRRMRPPVCFRPLADLHVDLPQCLMDLANGRLILHASYAP